MKRQVTSSIFLLYYVYILLSDFSSDVFAPKVRFNHKLLYRKHVLLHYLEVLPLDTMSIERY
jgi:hypothetical protein